MDLVEAYRPSVVARSGVTFHIEHVVPRIRGGLTILDNLALSCPGCNLAKGDRISAKDHLGREQALFNPRAFQSWLLGWHLHFILDLASGLISPRTSMAEATIDALKINDANRLFARRLQIEAGLIG